MATSHGARHAEASGLGAAIIRMIRTRDIRWRYPPQPATKEKEIRYMFKRKLALAMLMATIGPASIAVADNGVDITPYGPGGVQWTVSVPAYDTPLNYGQRVSDGYYVPAASTYRFACFALSPWLPVGHGNGWGMSIPDFYATW